MCVVCSCVHGPVHFCVQSSLSLNLSIVCDNHISTTISAE